jgi:hypothetical protein
MKIHNVKRYNGEYVLIKYNTLQNVDKMEDRFITKFLEVNKYLVK